jgi:hypothetical protein
MFTYCFNKCSSIRPVLNLLQKHGFSRILLCFLVSTHKLIKLLYSRSEFLNLVLGSFTSKVFIHENTEVTDGLLKLTERALGYLLDIICYAFICRITSHSKWYFVYFSNRAS